MHKQVSLVLSAIGQPRLAPYRSFFRCSNENEVLGAYFWGQAIGGAFQPSLSMYEVALRNAIHLSASRFSSKATSESYPWFDSSRTDALPIRGKTALKVQEVLSIGEPPLRRDPQPVPDVVVASLSFGFWPSFLEGLTKREQPRILTDTFHSHPNSNPRHWGVQKNVEGLIFTLKSIQNLRNSIAHHEPIWKPHRLKGNELNWSHSVVSLREKHDEIIKVMAWCSPAAAIVMENSYVTRMFKSICSTHAVRSFMSDPFGSGSMTLFEPEKPVAIPIQCGIVVSK